jgi:hypothetical protein
MPLDRIRRQLQRHGSRGVLLSDLKQFESTAVPSRDGLRAPCFHCLASTRSAIPYDHEQWFRRIPQLLNNGGDVRYDHYMGVNT